MSEVLVDGVLEAVKREIKKQEGGFLPALLAPLAPSLLQSVISSVDTGITGRGVRRAEWRYMNKTFCSTPSF